MPINKNPQKISIRRISVEIVMKKMTSKGLIIVTHIILLFFVYIYFFLFYQTKIALSMTVMT